MIASPETWREIRKASEAGVPDGQLSEDYGVSKGAIKVRRLREQWATQTRINAEVEAQKARGLALARGIPKNAEGVTHVTAEASIAQKLLADGELAGLHAMAILLKKLTFSAENPETIADLETVSDVSTAVKTARSIAGLDKSDVTVNVPVMFWNGQDASQIDSGGVIEVENEGTVET